VHWVDVDDSAALRILISDNRASELATWDDPALANLLKELVTETGTLDGTLFDGDALDAILADLGEAPFSRSEGEDDVPETPEQPISVLGDLWTCGEHRVLCGDSTVKEHAERLFDGQEAVLFVTDPPYGINFQSGMSDGGTKARFRHIRNDDRILNVAPVIWSRLANDSAAFIWTGQKVYPSWREQFSKFYKSTIIWHKSGGGIGDLEGDYAADYEMCLFCVKGRPTFRGKRGMAVWTIAKDQVMEYAHPTQKPVALAEKPIVDFSDTGGVVADLFLGSGSTLIACEKTGRRCLGMELAPEYVDVIVKRWQTFTGKEATLEGDGRTFAEVSAARTKKSKRKSA
jgi:DNA modification methylase